MTFGKIPDPSFGPPPNWFIRGHVVLDPSCSRATLRPSRVESLMASERIQRQIDRLLDDAEEALARFGWDSVRQCAEAELRFDPESLILPRQR